MFEANIKTKIRTFATFSDFNRILTVLRMILNKECFGGQNNLERGWRQDLAEEKYPPALKEAKRTTK